MKIKRKVQKTLPQLIEWAWDNNVKNERYRCSDSNPYEYVWINENSDVELDEDMCISKNDTFTVEVEEEITEDTVIDNLYKMDEFYEFCSTEYKTIKDVIRHSVFKVKAVYLNDDLTMTLIWRDGKLVE